MIHQVALNSTQWDISSVKCFPLRVSSIPSCLHGQMGILPRPAISPHLKSHHYSLQSETKRCRWDSGSHSHTTLPTLPLSSMPHPLPLHRVMGKEQYMSDSSRVEANYISLLWFLSVRHEWHSATSPVSWGLYQTRLQIEVLALVCQLNSASVKCDRTIRGGGNKNPKSNARAPRTRPRGVLCQSKLKVIS